VADSADVQSLLHEVRGEKRMPDGFCHRAFFLLELLCKGTLQNVGLRVFDEAETSLPRSRIPPFGDLAMAGTQLPSHAQISFPSRSHWLWFV